MDAEQKRQELRADLLQASTTRQRLAVLASIRAFLRTLPAGPERTRTLVLIGYGYADPVGRWSAVLTFAAAAAAELYHAPQLAPFVAWLRGVALCEIGRPAAGARYLGEALASFEAQGLTANAGEAGAWLAYALARAGHVDAARAQLHRIPAGTAAVHIAAAHLAAAEGNLPAAATHARTALPLLTAPKDAGARWLLLTMLARCADAARDGRTRRLALQEAANLTLVTWRAALTRAVLHLREIGGETLDEALAAGRRSWMLTGTAASGIPGPGLRAGRNSALSRLSQRVA